MREIHDSLRLAWNEFGEYFVVYQQLDDGTEHMVTTAQTADARLVKRIQKIASSQYNFPEEVDRLDKQAKKEADYKFSQQIGEIAERVAHAVRKDMSTPRTDINRHSGQDLPSK